MQTNVLITVLLYSTRLTQIIRLDNAVVYIEVMAHANVAVCIDSAATRHNDEGGNTDENRVGIVREWARERPAAVAVAGAPRTFAADAHHCLPEVSYVLLPLGPVKRSHRKVLEIMGHGAT